MPLRRLRWVMACGNLQLSLHYNITTTRPMTSPLHLQLAQLLRERIVRGTDAPGSMLPTEQALVERYGISRTVVRQAMQSLATEGLIVRIAGKGTFVRSERDPLPQAWSVGSLDELLAYGLDTRLEVLSMRHVPARIAIARLLAIDAGAEVLEIRGLRYAAQGLYSYQTNYFLRDIGAVLETADLSRGSLLEVLQSRVSLRLTHAEQTVSAEPADAASARRLKVAKGSPLLVIQRVFVSAERGPIEVGIMRYRPDRFRYHSKLTRSAAIPAAGTVSAAATIEGRRLALVAAPRGLAAARAQPRNKKRAR